MVASAFHNSLCQGVTHGKALAGAAVDEQAAAGGAVQARVADERRVLSAVVRHVRRWTRKGDTWLVSRSGRKACVFAKPCRVLLPLLPAAAACQPALKGPGRGERQEMLRLRHTLAACSPERGAGGRDDGDVAAVHALADVVVGLTHQLDIQALWQPSKKK